MKIAVLSDLHDNYTSWQIILKQLKEQKITTLIFCGDLCYPGTLKRMAQEFGGHIHLVHGNVADFDSEKRTADLFNNVSHYDNLGQIELANKKIAFTHLPGKAEKLTKSELYDYIFFGHTHQQSQNKIGNSVLLNPGTAGGMFQYPSYAIIDLVKDKIEFKQVTF